jgi:preprotein translocase subunit SecA
MESMKEGIGLRGYGQMDPLREYKKEGFALFEGLMDRIREEALMTLSRIRILKERPAEQDLPKTKRRAMQFSHGDSAGKAGDGQEGRKEDRQE